MITLTFDENKNYSSLEWLGWAEYAGWLYTDYWNTQSEMEQCGLICWEEREIGLIGMKYNPKLEHYFEDMAELTAWWETEVDKFHDEKRYLASCSDDDWTFYYYPYSQYVREYLLCGEYFSWAADQLKSGTRLHELPGWEE